MAAELRDDDIFVYMGGDQRVPSRVRRAKIHKDVKRVRARAFYGRFHLIYLEFHDEVEIIEEHAFYGCYSLRSAKLLGVKIIKKYAFYDCWALTDVEFGDKLETIEEYAFYFCKALKKIKIPSARTIGEEAFTSCSELTDVEFGEDLRTLQARAFDNCTKLKRIALPLLKSIMIEKDVFDCCPKLTTVDLVGGIHKTIASLLLESWRSEMNEDINYINQTLSYIPTAWKTGEIQQWIKCSFHQLNHYKAEHHRLLKEATTLLELALWKANLNDNNGGEGEGVRTTRSRRKRARKEICVTSGASIVIKNVLPFLLVSD